MKKLLILLLFVPMMAPAQSLRDRIDAGTYISEAEWRAMTAGKTVIYQRYGVEQGREYFPANNDQVFYQYAGGTCIEGKVIYQEPQFCFDYEDDERACFHHKRVGDDIFIIEIGGNFMTFVADIVDDPFRCTPPPMSALDLPFSFVSLK